MTMIVLREHFLQDTQGKTFTDVLTDPVQPFDLVLEFFADSSRQRRMEASELHHDRAALAGVVRELEAQPAVNEFFTTIKDVRSIRFRQAIGVLVRMIMEQRGWQKTGRKGSLGVREKQLGSKATHNSGGLAFWFIRAERYERPEGMPFQSVRERYRKITSEAAVSPDEPA